MAVSKTEKIVIVIHNHPSTFAWLQFTLGVCLGVFLGNHT
jgi:hypothetical protein